MSSRKEFTMKAIVTSLALVALAAAPLVNATSHAPATPSHSQHHALSDGEIRKVDKDAKKLTIRHGPIQSLDMPPMTMVFQVQDPRLLEGVKAGDKVKFAADRVGGTYTVTQIEPAK
jgi:Cu/Ag efflux protein CusF